MNNTYKVIFSKTTGTFIAVSENTKSQGKSTKSRKSINGIASAVVLYTIMGTAWAGPTGGNVVAGNATIGINGNTTIINQATKHAIINWKGFDVKSHETVQFNQNGINSVILNRVLSASPSLIDGAIKANGNVFIVNAAGVVIGKNANINVGGLVASSLDISNDDFMNGKYKFTQTNDTNAKIINEGQIQTTNGGLVSLIGGQVHNSGIIVAKEGTVALASGNAVSLTLGEGPTSHSIVVEKGTIDALLDIGGAVRVDGGNIILSARAVDGLLKNIINQHGILEASSMTKKGGKIILDGGNQGNVNLSGTINTNGVEGGKVVATGQNILVAGNITATGAKAGGEVYIGGGARGSDPLIEHAQNVGMKKSGTIDVSATDNGNGGKAVLWSDNSTQFYGDIKATGGKNGGNGGFIETSGKQLGFNGTVNVDAPKGKSGDILLDPDIIEIVSNPLNNPGPDDALLPSISEATNNTGKGSKSTVSVAALEAITSGTISLEASGYIRVNDLAANGGDGVLNLKDGVSLTLKTTNDVNNANWTPYPTGTSGGIGFVNPANIIVATGAGNVELSAGDLADYSGNGKLYNIGRIQTGMGSITLKASSGIDLLGSVVSTGGDININSNVNGTHQDALILGNAVGNPYKIKTLGGTVRLQGGKEGVSLSGFTDIGNGKLEFYSNATDDQKFIIKGNFFANNDIVFNRGVILGGSAYLRTPGKIHIGSTSGNEAMSLSLSSNVTFQSGGFVTTQASLDGNNSTLTLLGYSSSDPLYVGTGTTGVNLTPVFDIINGANINVGNASQTGKITINANTNIYGGANFQSSNIELTNVALTGTNNLSFTGTNITVDGQISTTGNAALNASSTLDLKANTKINAGDVAAISGTTINNAAGNTIFGTTPRWNIYVPDSSKLATTGFTLADGFRRYGCSLAGFSPSCSPGTSASLTGNGFYFKNAPNLTVRTTNVSSVYGTNITLTSFIDTAGLINGDSLTSIGLTGAATVGYVTAPGKSSSGNNKVGTYNLRTTKGTLASTMGYTFSGVTAGTHTITKATITPSFNAFDKTYDGYLYAIGGTVLDGIIGADKVDNNSGSALFRDKNVGSSKPIDITYVLGGVDAGNYSLSKTADIAYANITPRPINGSITANNKVYDGTLNASVNTFLGGLRGSDSVTLTASNITLTGKDVGYQQASANLAISGPDAYNYTLQNTSGYAVMQITPKTISSILSGVNKVYDGTTAATVNGNLNGVIGTDNVALQTTNANFSDKNVGNGKNIVTTLALGGSDAGNYVLDTTTGSTTANITPKTISSIINANGKTYDGTTAATVTGSLNGVITNDVVSLTATSANFIDKNVGTNKTVNATLGLTGADAGNYVLNTNTGTATARIDKRSILVGATANNKTYDGSTSATAQVNATGLIATDDARVNVTSANFADKNAGTNKNVSVNVALSGSDANNYILINSTASSQANILKKDITAILSANNKTYDGTTAATTSATVASEGALHPEPDIIIVEGGTQDGGPTPSSPNYAMSSIPGGSTTPAIGVVQPSSGIVAGDEVFVSTSNSNFNNKNAGTGKTVTAQIVLSGADANNYNVTNSTASTTANIDKKTVSGSIDIANKVYDGTTNATINSATISGIIGSDNVTIGSTSANFSDKNVGTGKNVIANITLNGADAGNYQLSSNTASDVADITKKNAYIGFTTNNKTYDGTTTANGNVNFTGVISGDDIRSSVIANFQDKNAGSGKLIDGSIKVFGSDINNYYFDGPNNIYLGNEISYNFITKADILKKNVNTTLVANEKTYDGTTNTRAVAHTSDFISEDTVYITTLNAQFADKNAGINKTVNANIVLTGNDADNYTLNNSNVSGTSTIHQKVIDATLNVNNKTYDGTTSATGSVSLDGLISSDNVIGNTSTLSFSDKNAGTGKTVVAHVALSGIDAGNYTTGSNIVSGTANIDKKNIVANITANNKTYDGTTNATGSATFDGVVSGDNVNAVLNGLSFADKNAGNTKTVIGNITLSGNDAANYQINNGGVSTTANILKKTISLTLDGLSKVYDGTTNAPGNITIYGAVTGETLTYNTNLHFGDKNAGINKTITGNISLLGESNINYTVSNPNLNGTGNILRRPINAIISAANKTYDGNTNAVATANLTGIIAGDNIASVINSSNFTDKNAGTGKEVSVNVGLTGNDANNYRLNISTFTTTADINKKAINAVFNADNKVYDGNVNATGNVALGGLIAGDSVNGILSGATFDDKNAGIGKTVNGTIVLSGSDLGNYILSDTHVSGTANIDKKIIGATLTADNKVYDGTINATGNVVLNGIINGDNVSSSVNRIIFDDKNAGSNKTVHADIGVAGSDANNYDLISPTITSVANIDKKAVNIAFNANNKTYDGTTNATGNVVLGGLIEGDDVIAALNSASFTDKNAGTNKLVNAVISLSGTDQSNYVLPTTSALTSTANIDKKYINATLYVDNKTYDGTTAATGNVSLNGLITGDNVNAVLNGLNFADKSAGINKVVNGSVSVSGNDLANYDLTSTNLISTANIDKKAISATFNAQNKTYDGTTNATGNVSLGGIITGDNVVASLNDVHFTDKNAGNNKTVSGTIGLAGNDLGNYDLINANVNTTANIDKKKIDGVLQVNNKVYDGTTNASATVSVNGLITGDNIIANVDNVKFTDKNAGNNKNVNGTINLSGNDATNYELNTTLASGVANIDKKALSATLTANGKVYDGNTSTNATANINGVIDGDNVIGSVVSARFTDKNAGINKTVTADINISGSDASNYQVDTTKVIGFADITKKRINARLNVNNKVYDGTTAANATAHFDGLVAGDNVAADIADIKFTDKNVGAGKTVSGSLNISGSDAGNYELPATSIIGTADITKKTINANINASNKTYDGTTSAQVVGTLNGAVAGDNVTAIVNNAQFNDKNAGKGKIVSANIGLSGQDSSNYELANNNATTSADITKKIINHNGVSIISKVYDGSNNASAQSNGISGLIEGDEVVALVDNAQFSDKNAGKNKDVKATIGLQGIDSINYELSSNTANGKGDIIAKTIEVSGTQVIAKTYDGTTAANINGSTLKGIINGDNINVVGKGSFNDKNAGNKTVNVVYGLDGVDAQNYVLANTNETLNGVINKRNVGFTVNGDSNRSYIVGTTPDITGFTSVLSNIVDGDNVVGNEFGLFANGKLYNGKLPGKYIIGLTSLSGNDSANYTIDYGTSLLNGPVATVVAPDNTPGRASLTEIRQLPNYVPVYANGRGIDNRARITSIATYEENGADTFKGSRAFAVGTRGSANSEIVIDTNIQEEKKEQ